MDIDYIIAKKQHSAKVKMINEIRTGDVVKVKSDLSSIIFHYGIVCKDNFDFYVYHNDPHRLNFLGGNIIRENFNDWIKSKEIVSITHTDLNVNDIEKATAALKTYKYDIFDFNCEHFISKLKEKKPSSPQVKEWSLIVASILMAAIIIKRK